MKIKLSIEVEWDDFHATKEELIEAFDYVLSQEVHKNDAFACITEFTAFKEEAT